MAVTRSYAIDGLDHPQQKGSEDDSDENGDCVHECMMRRYAYRPRTEIHNARTDFVQVASERMLR
jgi:hypothetical protein